jgi:hypothetical protein
MKANEAAGKEFARRINARRAAPDQGMRATAVAVIFV